MKLITAAASLVECQSALAKGPAAARAALAKHGGSIPAGLARALETVGSYTTIEVIFNSSNALQLDPFNREFPPGRTSLHEAVVNGDAATVKALIVAAGPKLIDARDSNGATALSLATDYTCRDILTHHKAICASVTEDPTKLIAAALAFCATHTDSEEPGPSSALSPRAHHFNPAFLWAPPAARAAVVAWAQLVFIDQFAATIQPFEDLPDDCAGDVLEFFGMTYKESERIAKHCSSPEARAWVRAVVAAAIVAKATAELVPAAREGDLATVQDCLSMKANIEIKHRGVTALMEASFSGHTDIVKVLIRAGANRDAKKMNGWTVLLYASIRGHTAIVQVLLRAGADKEARDKVWGDTALIKASKYGHTAIVQLLLGAGAEKDARDRNGNTALMEALNRGHTDIVQLLLGAGADKDVKDKNGWTALSYASAYGHTATVEVLLGAGADKEAKDNNGFTALMHASHNGHTALVQLLLGAGANKDAKNYFGRTALMGASKLGYNAIVQLLLGASADKDAKNESFGKAAWDVAKHWFQAEVVALRTK